MTDAGGDAGGSAAPEAAVTAPPAAAPGPGSSAAAVDDGGELQELFGEPDDEHAAPAAEDGAAGPDHGAVGDAEAVAEGAGVGRPPQPGSPDLSDVTSPFTRMTQPLDIHPAGEAADDPPEAGSQPWADPISPALLNELMHK